MYENNSTTRFSTPDVTRAIRQHFAKKAHAACVDKIQYKYGAFDESDEIYITDAVHVEVDVDALRCCRQVVVAGDPALLHYPARATVAEVIADIELALHEGKAS